MSYQLSETITSNKQIISERGINLYMYPVMKLPVLKIENSKFFFESEENGYWSNRSYNMMDFLSTKIQIKFANENLQLYDKILSIDDIKMDIHFEGPSKSHFKLIHSNSVFDINK